VPAHEERKVNKAPSLGADVVVLDMEDGVPRPEKDAARHLAGAALGRRAGWPLYFVRVNGAGSGELRADLDAVVHLAPDGLVLPKVERSEDVVVVDNALRKRERQAGLAPVRIRLLATIESAKGLTDAPAISSSCSRVVGLLFGAEDFALDIGLSLIRDTEASEMIYARSALAVAAASAGLHAIDRVCTDIRSLDRLQMDIEQALRLGFSGKAVVHPDQVALVNDLFRPQIKEVAYARRVVEAFERAEIEGKGAISLDGRLIDRPIIERARRVLQTHQLLEERGR
jgi:citrate lyase subunit beta/citryl-CoA lyase